MKAVIFDLDGTLVDSDPAWFVAHQRAARSHGVEITDDNFRDFVHKGGIYEWLVGNHNISVSKEEFWKSVEGHLYSLLKEGIVPIPGATQVVKRLAKSYKIGLATSATSSYAEHVLKELGIMDEFEAVVGSDHVENTKPYPDIYIEVLKRLRIGPKDAVAVEDSLRGLESAKSAGLKCIVVVYRKDNTLDFSKADSCLENLDELTPELIQTF